jgi:hypothetical protein
MDFFCFFNIFLCVFYTRNLRNRKILFYKMYMKLTENNTCKQALSNVVSIYRFI